MAPIADKCVIVCRGRVAEELSGHLLERPGMSWGRKLRISQKCTEGCFEEVEGKTSIQCVMACGRRTL